MILDSEQKALDFIASLKSDADSDNTTFLATWLSFVDSTSGDSDNFKTCQELLETYGPLSQSPNLTVVAAFEQHIDSEHHTGLV